MDPSIFTSRLQSGTGYDGYNLAIGLIAIAESLNNLAKSLEKPESRPIAYEVVVEKDVEVTGGE